MNYANLSNEKLKKLARAYQRLKLLEEKEAQETSLSDFLKGAWKYIDPNPFVPAWHIEAIAEHLEAVTNGQIRRLLINVPPRSSKSSLVAVAWPAWTWCMQDDDDHPLMGPRVQFLFASYAQHLSIRDSAKTRRLINSPWYQERWNERFQLSGDQNAKIKFENTRGGYRMATSVGGTLTGEGGSIIVVDDAHNAQEAESDAVRESTIDWWKGSLSTRLNDPKTGAYVVIMQRLHMGDLAGHIIENDTADEWTQLILPMRHEIDRHCITGIGWEDPRTKEGELLCPERFPEEVVKTLERELGPFAAAGQLQQMPKPKGGGIIKREYWKLWDDDEAKKQGVEKGRFPVLEFVLASADTAYGEKEYEGDYSALSVWGIWTDRDRYRRVMLLHCWKCRLPLHELVGKIAGTCNRFKADRLLIEAKASGVSVAQEIRRLHFDERWGVVLTDPKKQDKIARTYSVEPFWADGYIYAPDRDWADLLINEMEDFPKGLHDDMHDSATQAIRFLRDTGMLEREKEHRALEKEQLAFKPSQRPLYEV